MSHQPSIYLYHNLPFILYFLLLNSQDLFMTIYSYMNYLSSYTHLISTTLLHEHNIEKYNKLKLLIILSS